MLLALSMLTRPFLLAHIQNGGGACFEAMKPVETCIESMPGVTAALTGVAVKSIVRNMSMNSWQWAINCTL